MRVDVGAFSIVSPGVCKSHLLRFSGAEGLAEQRARKFMQLQKVGTSWRKLGALDEKQVSQPLFVDGDKNPKMVRTDILSKRLALLLEKHTQKKFYPKRKEGKVFIDYVPVARILVTSADAFSVE